MADTINAETGQVETNPNGAIPLFSRQPAQPMSTVPSLINVPPQIAVTVFWVALGVGLGYWLFARKGPH